MWGVIGEMIDGVGSRCVGVDSRGVDFFVDRCTGRRGGVLVIGVVGVSLPRRDMSAGSGALAAHFITSNHD